MHADDGCEPKPATLPAAQVGTPPRFLVETLLGSSTEAILVHAGAEYRLRITAAGRLILTK